MLAKLYDISGDLFQHAIPTGHFHCSPLPVRIKNWSSTFSIRESRLDKPTELASRWAMRSPKRDLILRCGFQIARPKSATIATIT